MRHRQRRQSELSTFDSGCQFSQLDLNCSEASGSASEASEASASTSDASDASDASEDAAMPLIFGRVSRTTYRTAALNDTACVDIDECAVNNGHCDMLVGCTNTPGGREWGACPHRFVGSSELSTFDSGCQFSQPGLNSSTALVIPSVTLTLDNVQATMFSGPEHELVVFTL